MNGKLEQRGTIKTYKSTPEKDIYMTDSGSAFRFFVHENKCILRDCREYHRLMSGNYIAYTGSPNNRYEIYNRKFELLSFKRYQAPYYICMLHDTEKSLFVVIRFYDKDITIFDEMFNMVADSSGFGNEYRRTIKTYENYLMISNQTNINCYEFNSVNDITEYKLIFNMKLDKIMCKYTILYDFLCDFIVIQNEESKFIIMMLSDINKIKITTVCLNSENENHDNMLQFRKESFELCKCSYSFLNRMRLTKTGKLLCSCYDKTYIIDIPTFK
jgi:hypothetical protein